MLGFDSAYEKTDGRYVRVEVKTKRPELTVHSRDGYVAPTKREKQSNAKRFASTPAPVATALASPLPTNGIALHVSAVSTRGRGRNANVAVTADINANTLGLVAKDGGYAGDLEMRYIATDAKRQIFPEVRQAGMIRLDPRPEAETASLSGVRVRIGTTLELPPGRYQIRVAAGTALTSGNVIYDLKIPDFSDAPISMSSIALVKRDEDGILTLNATGGSRSAKATKCWSSNCAAPSSTLASTTLTATAPEAGARPDVLLPTTTRVFAPGDEIQIGTEVYDNRKTKKGEPAKNISFTVSLRNAEGRVIPLHSEDRPSPPLSADATHRFAVPVRLTDVEPGSYALDVVVRSSAGDDQIVKQSIPIRIEAPDRRDSIDDDFAK
jgi:hypothetical protein